MRGLVLVRSGAKATKSRGRRGGRLRCAVRASRVADVKRPAPCRRSCTPRRGANPVLTAATRRETILYRPGRGLRRAPHPTHRPTERHDRSTRRQDRLRHRRRPGHRPRRRRGLRARGRTRHRHRHQRGAARRTRARHRLRDAPARRHRRQRGHRSVDRGRHRRGRRALQRRRLRPRRHHPRLRRGGLRLLVRPQRALDVPHDPRASCRRCSRTGSGSIINVAVGGVEHQGRAEPLRLRRDQGRGDRHDQVDRRRLHHPRHPLQRDLPRHDRVAVAAPAHRRAGEGERPDAGRRSRPRSSRASRWAASARTDEIAALAVYLACDESAFTTGTAQVIDGGWSN